MDEPCSSYCGYVKTQPRPGRIAADAARALRHPAFLFSAGNTALAVGQAHLPALLLNIALTMLIYGARFFELRRQQPIGIPFVVLASVNLATAVSVEINKAMSFSGGLHFVSLDHQSIAAHISAFAYAAWTVGHIFAGRNEKTGVPARRAAENPQTYYGIGDIAAVNAAGTINPFPSRSWWRASCKAYESAANLPSREGALHSYRENSLPLVSMRSAISWARSLRWERATSLLPRSFGHSPTFSSPKTSRPLCQWAHRSRTHDVAVRDVVAADNTKAATGDLSPSLTRSMR